MLLYIKKLGLHSHSYGHKSIAQLILIDVGISIKLVGKRHYFDNEKSQGSKISMFTECTAYVGDLGFKVVFNANFKAKKKKNETVQLKYIAFGFHVWKWVSQSNSSGL